MNANLKNLFEHAQKARENSYSPYSRHKVGAAVRTTSGKIYSGCNVENSSYGATNCAERVAIQNAIAAEGRVEIAEIIVVTDAPVPWPPCGMCRQVLAEFGKPGMLIHAANLDAGLTSSTLGELLPHAFTPEFLEQ